MKGYLIPLLILFPLLLISQNADRFEKQAATLFEKGDFVHALQIYEVAEKAKPNDPGVLTHIGICHFENNNLTKAEECLNRFSETDNDEFPSAYLYLGKLHHAQLDFEKAIHFYKLFLKNTSDKEPLRAAVKDAILRCANGMMVRRQPPVGSIAHLSSPVNSVTDEYKPLFSPNNPTVLYFASDRRQNPDGTFSSDIYSTERGNGVWSPPASIGLTLNSPAFEKPLGFNTAGDLLYFYRGKTPFSGDVLVDTFKEDIMEKNVLHAEFISPMRVWEGDCDPHFFNDTTLLFASRRPGGQGGLDIYLTTLTQNGWTPPLNLGPVINSVYDDRSPFLAADGHTLYFSTNDARRSIGGLDILKSVYLDRVNKWTPPENLGFPFNSAADDEGFSLSENGRSALFSSSRKTGFGRRDLYMGIFPEKEKTQRGQPSTLSFQNTEKANNSRGTGNELDTLGKYPTDFTIRPLHHAGPLLPLPEETLVELRKVAILLKTYPQTKITLVGYSAEGENGPLPISTILDKATAFLQAEGASLRQIKWLVATAKFSPKKDGPRIIDIFPVYPEILPSYIKITQTEGTSFEAKFFQKSMNSLVYRAQVPLNENTQITELIKIYPEGSLLQHAGTGQQWFTPGYHFSWEAAIEDEKAIRQMGFEQAGSVPVLNGWELDKNTASQHLHEYPELEFFIGRK